MGGSMKNEAYQAIFMVILSAFFFFFGGGGGNIMTPLYPRN